MKQKHVPVRMCAACRQHKPKHELIRIAKLKQQDTASSKEKNKNSDKEGNSDYEVFIDEQGKNTGRGTYICNSPDCLKKAKKIKKIEREFSFARATAIYSKLEETINNSSETIKA